MLFQIQGDRNHALSYSKGKKVCIFCLILFFLVLMFSICMTTYYCSVNQIQAFTASLWHHGRIPNLSAGFGEFCKSMFNWGDNM